MTSAARSEFENFTGSAAPSDAARNGRDAVLPHWLAERHFESSSAFDSVVVRGNGVSALACAARLGRAPELKDRTTLLGTRPTESAKLINGCTLRSRALDYLAAATGVSDDQILASLLGRDIDRARTTRQFFSLFEENGGAFHATRMAEFMPPRNEAATYAFGVRNSRLARTLADLCEQNGLTFDESPADSLDACRNLARGHSPIVINGSHAPLAAAPLAAPPNQFVIAWQATMKRSRTGPLPDHASLIAGVRRATGIDIGVFYPFADPMTPDADGYGLFYRVVQPAGDFDKHAVIEEMRAAVLGIGRAIGWELIDEEATAAGAQVPAFSWEDVQAPDPGYFDLHRTFSAGVPIITGCGMTRAGLSGWLTAECVLRGEHPAPAVNRSLRRWRRLNRQFNFGMTDPTPVTAALLTRFPGPIVRLLADRPDVWASASCAS